MAKKKARNVLGDLVGEVAKDVAGVAIPGQAHVKGSLVDQVLGSSDQAPSSSQPDPQEHRAGVTYDPAQLIKTYFPSLNDAQIAAVRQQLAPFEAQGGPEYHKALTDLAASYPALQAKSALSQAFPDTTSQADPLAFQAFFSQAVAPYLQQIGQQNQAVTAPLYKQLQGQLSHLPGQYGSVLGAAIPQMQIDQSNMETALSGAAPAAPGLQAIVQNAQAAQAAALKSYYESIAGRAYGSAAGGAGGLPPGVTIPSTTK